MCLVGICVLLSNVVAGSACMRVYADILSTIGLEVGRSARGNNQVFAQAKKSDWNIYSPCGNWPPSGGDFENSSQDHDLIDRRVGESKSGGCDRSSLSQLPQQWIGSELRG